MNDQQTEFPHGRCKDNLPGKNHTESSLGWPGVWETVNAANLVNRKSNWRVLIFSTEREATFLNYSVVWCHPII